jgi:hypothetical protein
MGTHDEHLPKRKHLNKTAGHGAQPADPKTLAHVARGQGQGTKDDAKAAKAKAKLRRGKS